MQNKGHEAERRAENFLQQQKLKLLERNYRCRFGEIDLIMQEGDTLVFVEVRMRTSHLYGGAAASITAAKQTKLIQTARHYLSRHEADQPCRFDAILISGNQEIEWIQNAFDEH
ncbi:MAG TPA: YraN family protein [Nitrosomonas halophila]|nr:YraN family protein [Nitrosomonas halophila]